MAMNLKHKRVLQNSLTTCRTWIISWHQSWRSYTWTRNLWTATFLSQFFHFFPTTWKTGHLPHLQSTVSVGCVVWGFLQGRIPWPEGRAQHLENCALRTAEPNLKDFAEIVNTFAFCLFLKFVMKCESNSNSFVTSISTRRFISLFHPLSWFNTEHRSFAKQVTWMWHQADVIADLKLPAAHCRGAGGLNFRQQILEKIQMFYTLHLTH